MKITNNEIVVEWPEGLNAIDPVYYVVVKHGESFKMSKKSVIMETEKLNPPLVVDVEALATLIGDSDYSYDGNSEKLAQHLAANLDKWLIEKKEDRTDEQ